MRSKKKYKFYLRKLRIFILQMLLVCAVTFADIVNRIKKDKPNKKRILVIVFGGLGDCLLFDVLLRRIREHYNKNNEPIEIDVLTGSFIQMWEMTGSAENIILFERYSNKFPLGYLRLFYFLHRRQYDQSIEAIAMLPRRGVWSVMTGLFIKAAWAKIKVVRKSTGVLQMQDMPFAGFKSSTKKEASYYRVIDLKQARLIELPAPDKRSFHEARYVAKAMGIDYYRYNNEPCLYIEASKSPQYERNDKIKIALLIETTYAIKAWPEKNYLALIDKLAQSKNMQFVLIGVEPLNINFISNLPDVDIINLSAKTTLQELIKVIQQCQLFIGADTGPAHIAQALGIPSVVLFGPSNEKEFGPIDQHLHATILPEKHFTCRPCVLGPCIKTKSCMHSISVDIVYNKAMQMLEKKYITRPAKRYTHPKLIFKV